MMERLLAIVISWGRPHFLERTLETLSAQLESMPSDLVVVDNGSDKATREVIRNHCGSANMLLWEENCGINTAVESALTRWLTPEHRSVLVSDADMEYHEPLSPAIDLLKSRLEIGAVSLQHSPEHPVHDTLVCNDRSWPLKRSERGCSLLLRVEALQRVRPLPIHNLKDFDWWVCRDAPQSLQTRNESIAIMVGGARHLGWRRGDSTWQDIEIQEYADLK
jgi:glycosyltransferase involved in cell wall biosynthesis